MVMQNRDLRRHANAVRALRHDAPTPMGAPALFECPSTAGLRASPEPAGGGGIPKWLRTTRVCAPQARVFGWVKNRVDRASKFRNAPETAGPPSTSACPRDRCGTAALRAAEGKAKAANGSKSLAFP